MDAAYADFRASSDSAGCEMQMRVGFCARLSPRRRAQTAAGRSGDNVVQILQEQTINSVLVVHCLLGTSWTAKALVGGWRSAVIPPASSAMSEVTNVLRMEGQ
jgi:hypothetical protein